MCRAVFQVESISKAGYWAKSVKHNSNYVSLAALPIIFLYMKMARFHHSPEWQKCRRRFILSKIDAGEYRCSKCGADGQYIPLQVDHVRPLRKGGRPLDEKNLQLLCEVCHIEKSRSDNSRRKMEPERKDWARLVGF